jgi:hypothetical protein
MIEQRRMATRLSDTSAEAERVQIEIHRSMPSWRKLQLVNDLVTTTRILALTGLRERFPAASSEELRRRLASIVLGPDLASRVYGPEPHPPTIR